METVVLITLGLITGSFLNVVIYRLPVGLSIVKPRSFCPECGHKLRWFENVPVVSYFLLGGKCTHCGKGISMRYPLVEVFTALTFYLSYLYFGEFPIHAGLTTIFLCVLIILALTDIKHMILPDPLTIGGAMLFLGYSLVNPEGMQTTSFKELNITLIEKTSFIDGLVSGLGGALVFLILYLFYLKVRKIEGLGQGDIKMMLLLGFFLGMNRLVVALLIASVTGLITGLFFIIFKGKDLKMQIPFGTFLALGSYISVFFGKKLLFLIQTIF